MTTTTPQQDPALSLGRVRLTGRGRKRWLRGHPWIYADDLSQVEAVLTFGLGKSRQADRVRVFWPGAKTPQKLGSVPAGTTRVVRQP